jgi:hypothetical protein
MQPTGAGRLSALAAAGVVGLAAAVVGLVVFASSTGSVRPISESTRTRTPPPLPTLTPTDEPMSSGQSAAPQSREPFDLPDWLVPLLKVLVYAGTTLVVGAIVFLLVRLLLRFLRALRMPEVEPDNTEDWERVATERLTQAVDSGLGALDSGSSADAIIACWVALEQAAATAGVARLPAETPSEFTVRVLALGNVSAADLDELAELYREARFSSHTSSESARHRARKALLRLRAELAPAEAAP